MGVDWALAPPRLRALDWHPQEVGWLLLEESASSSLIEDKIKHSSSELCILQCASGCLGSKDFSTSTFPSDHTPCQTAPSSAKNESRAIECPGQGSAWNIFGTLLQQQIPSYHLLAHRTTQEVTYVTAFCLWNVFVEQQQNSRSDSFRLCDTFQFVLNMPQRFFSRTVVLL